MAEFEEGLTLMRRWSKYGDRGSTASAYVRRDAVNIRKDKQICKRKAAGSVEYRRRRLTGQNGLTTAKITMTINRAVGTSLRIRKNFADFLRLSAPNSRTYFDRMP